MSQGHRLQPELALPRIALDVDVWQLLAIAAEGGTFRPVVPSSRRPVYWIVAADQHEVEIWTPAEHTPRIEREHLTWDPAGASATFDLSLAQLFRPV